MCIIIIIMFERYIRVHCSRVHFVLLTKLISCQVEIDSTSIAEVEVTHALRSVNCANDIFDLATRDFCSTDCKMRNSRLGVTDISEQCHVTLAVAPLTSVGMR